jgi:hypothetical protein
MRFTFTIEVEVERESGKFASRDEIIGEIEQALEDANYGEISGIGSDGDSTYSVIDWSVSTT